MFDVSIAVFEMAIVCKRGRLIDTEQDETPESVRGVGDS